MHWTTSQSVQRKELLMSPHRLPYKAYTMSYICMNKIGEHGHPRFAMCYTNMGLMTCGKTKEWVMKKRLLKNSEKGWLHYISMNGWTVWEPTTVFLNFTARSSRLCPCHPSCTTWSMLRLEFVLMRIRLGVSSLKTHKRRFTKNATHAELVCPFCRNETETEVHYILTCPRYEEIWE